MEDERSDSLTPISVDPESIPDELLKRDQWLFWNSSDKTPRKALPSPAADYGASWSDPSEWVDSETAIEGAERVDDAGIGYVVASENPDYPRGIYGVIDLDGALDKDGTPKDWLPSLDPFIEHDAYIEWSPSHNEPGDSGLHIPVAGLKTPTWWADTHFNDDEHEGVEVLTHNFCTFTGDPWNESSMVVDYGKWVDDWLAEAYEAITGEDPRNNDESDRFGDGFDGDRSHITTDEWIDAETAADALDHIDPDVSYPAWRSIGFALKDHFDRLIAERLFTEWSRHGTKWDDNAQQQAEQILDHNGSTSNPVTIATLVEKAKEGGWDPSPAGSATDLIPRTDGDLNGESDETWSWDQRFGAWLHAERRGRDEDNSGREPSKSEKRERLADELTVDYRFAARYIGSGSAVDTVLYRYDPDNGHYRKDGAKFVEERLEKDAPISVEDADVKAVVNKIRRRNVVHTDTFHPAVADDGRINVANGILDPKTGDLESHSPETVFTRQIPWDYDPDANAEAIIDFVEDVTGTEAAARTLIEWVGFGLKPDYSPEKFLLLTGEGRNGKGLYFEILEAFYGGATSKDGNISAVDLASITGNGRFDFSRLDGSLMNIDGDVAGGSFTSENLSKLKKMTGGDYIKIEEKNEPAYDAKNRAKMAFAANEPPRFNERSSAIAERLLHIEFPYKYTAYDDEHKDLVPKEGMKDRLITDEQMSGLLNVALDALRQIEDHNRFSIEIGRTAKERFDRYHHASDPIAGFADRCLNETGDELLWLPKSVVYSTYENWVQAEMGSKNPAANSVFWRKLGQFIDYDECRPKIGDRQEQVIQGLWFTPTVAEYIPDVAYQTVPTMYQKHSDLEPEAMPNLPTPDDGVSDASDNNNGSADGDVTKPEENMDLVDGTSD